MLKRENVLAEDSRRIPKVVRLFVVLLILAPLAAWLLFAQGGLEALKLATTHQPEPFTELYFVRPTRLPEAVTPNKTYAQTFTIVNHDAPTRIYTYQVTIRDKQGERRQKPVSVTVQNGQQVQQTFRYSTAAIRSPVMITVTLLDQQQSIHFRTKS